MILTYGSFSFSDQGLMLDINVALADIEELKIGMGIIEDN